MTNPRTLYRSSKKIAARVAFLGARITKDYAYVQEGGRPLLVLGVLDGGFMFTADLIRQIHLPVRIEFCRLESYRGGTAAGELQWKRFPPDDITGSDVLVVDDIVDTGATIERIMDWCLSRQPRSLRVAALLANEQYHGQRPPLLDLRYVGFIVPEDLFYVGYGLDHNDTCRNLPAVYTLDSEA